MPDKTINQDFYPVAMTIAGSDCGGGAGIQADLRTFNAFGVYGTSVVTGLTAQNPFEVRKVELVTPEMVQTQLEAVLDTIAVSHIKCGMLGSAQIVGTVARTLATYGKKAVVDPVMVSTSKARLLADDAIESLKKELFPVAEYITPNIPEAELLLGSTLRDNKDMLQAARECAKLYKCTCILKGGHMKGDEKHSFDFIARDGMLYELVSPRVELANPLTGHGTGCTFSAALTAALTLHYPWKEALKMAKAFVYGSLVETVQLGDGIDAMYPPVEVPMEDIALREVKL